MKKGLVIKLAIVLIVLTLSYCVFWFFKAGQSEKQINKFITENSANISAGEISVSGFPIAQKITINDLKITVPFNVVAKRQIQIKRLEASASIFSNDFNVALVDGVKLQDMESVGEVFDVEFVNQPEIVVSLANGILSKLQYNDAGFKVIDAEKNVVNSSTGTTITSETSIDETEKRVSKIHIAFKELEGYTVVDFYKNVIEKRVIEGIKTEEIKINGSAVSQEVAVDTASAVAPAVTDNVNKDVAPNSATANNKNSGKADKANPAPVVANNSAPKNGEDAIKRAVEASKEIAKKNNPTDNVANKAPAPEANAVANPQPATPNVVDPNNPPVASANSDQPNPQVAPEDSSNAEAISDSSIIKSNVTIDLVITLTPSVKQESEAPSDPTQIQELPVQYVQNIKVENFEMANPLYKINISGDVVSSSDDNNPSGGITVKVEKIANLLQQLKAQFKKHAELKKSSMPATGVDIGTESPVNQVPNYDVFLGNLSEKITDVAMEISAKNSVSKDDVAQFDIRREKNLEFLVNEVPVREILGKF